MSHAYTLITGASSGIGLAVAKVFASKGRNLILIARREERLHEVALEVEKYKVDVRVYPIDITDHKVLEKTFLALEELSIDVVINNAGLAIGKESFEEYAFADVEQMIDVNISAFLKVAHLSIPFLRKTKGHLINLGSIAGIDTYAGGTVYCATKHFVHAFTRGLREDLLGSGIRITTVAPGRVATEFSLVRFKGDTSKADAVYENVRCLQPEDIADAILYAVSCPKHVNIEQMLVMPTDQAGKTMYQAP